MQLTRQVNASGQLINSTLHPTGWKLPHSTSVQGFGLWKMPACSRQHIKVNYNICYKLNNFKNCSYFILIIQWDYIHVTNKLEQLHKFILNEMYSPLRQLPCRHPSRRELCYLVLKVDASNTDYVHLVCWVIQCAK